MLILQNITYLHPDRELLFNDLHITVGDNERCALVGNNGSGKSTLLKIMAGCLPASEGRMHASSPPYYVPQLFGQLNHLTVGEALNVHDKIHALRNIEEGIVTEENMAIVGDDWTLAERCRVALDEWGLKNISPGDSLARLSGGQKTRVLLAGISIHQPRIILLDEPTNHLDLQARKKLYRWLEGSSASLLVVSHDRRLLNLLDVTYELTTQGISRYGGNYEFYREQKQLEKEALIQDVRHGEKTLREARKAERETLERKQKLDARGKKKQEKSGLPTIMMNTLRNQAQKSTARLKDIHAGRIEEISDDLLNLRRQLPTADEMRLTFSDPALYSGKMVAQIRDVNFHYGGADLWTHPLNLEIVSGDRIVLRGRNGSGKTTLLQLLLGNMEPTTGAVKRSFVSPVFLDQDYSSIDGDKTVYLQAAGFNNGRLQEHEIKNLLTRFLFDSESWLKPCSSLSGGEKMRLVLCCLVIRNIAPDIIILDEPTNNLDLQNVTILTNAIASFNGTLVVISHDEIFLEQLGLTKAIDLDEHTRPL